MLLLKFGELLRGRVSDEIGAPSLQEPIDFVSADQLTTKELGFPYVTKRSSLSRDVSTCSNYGGPRIAETHLEVILAVAQQDHRYHDCMMSAYKKKSLVTDVDIFGRRDKRC